MSEPAPTCPWCQCQIDPRYAVPPNYPSMFGCGSYQNGLEPQQSDTCRVICRDRTIAELTRLLRAVPLVRHADTIEAAGCTRCQWFAAVDAALATTPPAPIQSAPAEPTPREYGPL